MRTAFPKEPAKRGSEQKDITTKETINMKFNEKEQNYIITAPPAPRSRLHLVNGGANRGARLNAPAIRDFNATSERAEIAVTYADVLPGRAAAMVKEAEGLGITATAFEGKVEDLVKTSGDTTSPIVLNVDRASAIAGVLRDPATASHPILAYLLLRLPSNRLWAIRIVLTPAETSLRDDAARFFECIARVSERNTSNAIVGETADPAHRLLEPKIREWFSEHTKKNLEKIAAAVEPASCAFEVTMSGSETLPLFIVAKDAWSDAAALAEAVLADPQFPIRKGTQFVVAEIVGDELRFHAVRRRTDDRVTVSGVEVVTRASLEARQRADAARIESERQAEMRASEDAERTRATTEALARAAVVALASAARETVSRRNPVATTD